MTDAGIRRSLVKPTFVFLFALALDLLNPQTVTAGGFTTLTTTTNNLVTALTAIGIGIVTIALMVAGYKMSFKGQGWAEVSNIVIGGCIAGGAAGLAAWIFTGV